MLVVLATWEAEIGRITFPCQPGLKVHNKKLGVVVHTCHSSYTGSVNRRMVVLDINVRPYLKNT
jgi:hypothetical protein